MCSNIEVQSEQVVRQAQLTYNDSVSFRDKQLKQTQVRYQLGEQEINQAPTISMQLSKMSQANQNTESAITILLDGSFQPESRKTIIGLAFLTMRATVS